MRYLLVLVALLCLAGCGKSEVVRLGEPGEKGTYERQIDKSKDTAAAASAKVKEGDKEAFGS